MSGPKHYTYSFRGRSRPETLEILGVLGQVSGVSIRIRGGEIVCDYTDTSGWTYSSLSDLIHRAQKVAAQNLVYVKQVVEQDLAEISSLKSSEQISYKESSAKINESLKRLESIKARLSMKLETPGRTISFDKELQEIECQISKVNKDLRELNSAHEKAKSGFDAYETALRNAETSAQLEAAERGRPRSSYGAIDPSLEVDNCIDKLEKRYGHAVAFVNTANKLYEFIEKENLEEYRVRVDDKVKALDPFDPNSLKEMNKLIETIINEHQFRMQQKANDALKEQNAETVAEQLKVLKEISQSLRPLILKLDQEQHEVVDVSSGNKEAINKIESVISSIKGYEYISRGDSSQLLNIEAKLNRLKGMNLDNPRIAVELSSIAAEAARLLASVDKDNVKYREYKEVVDEYVATRTALLGVSEDVKELVDLSKMTFNTMAADRLINDLKEQTKEMQKILDEVMAHSFVNSIAAAVGEEQILKKEQAADKVGFSFVRQETKGVIYCVEKDETGASITPRGVILSSGQKAIDEEGLRKVHGSCEWSNDLNEKLVKIGMPPFEATEKGKEATEALYAEEEYYYIESDEESIAYLKKCGYSDEEIENVFGYDVANRTYKEESKRSVRKAAAKKEIKL